MIVSKITVIDKPVERNMDIEGQLTVKHLPFDILVAVFTLLNLKTLCVVERGKDFRLA